MISEGFALSFEPAHSLDYEKKKKFLRDTLLEALPFDAANVFQHPGAWKEKGMSQNVTNLDYKTFADKRNVMMIVTMPWQQCS